MGIFLTLYPLKRGKDIKSMKNTPINELGYTGSPVKESQKKYPADAKAILLEMESMGITGDYEETQDIGDMIIGYL
jgi:hypothetical protein